MEATDPTNKGRIFDLGVRALDDGCDSDIGALDLCVSDCCTVTGKPPLSYQTGGAKGEAKGKHWQKRRSTWQPHWQAFHWQVSQSRSSASRATTGTGTKDADAAGLHKRIIKALASANPTTPYSAIASRVHRLVSLAIQQSIAFNALQYRYTKLGASTTRRIVGSGAVEQQPDAVAVANAFDDWEDDEPESGPEGEGLEDVVMGVQGGGEMVGHGQHAVVGTGPALAAPGLHGQLDDVAMEPAEGHPAAHAGGDTGAGEVHRMLGSPISAM